jgi:cytochrome c oxidase subunit 2
VNELLRRLLFLPEQGSTLAADVDALHYFVIGVTMLGATGVALVAVVFVIRFHSRGVRDEEAYTPSVQPPRWFEAAVVSGLLGLFLLWWAIGYRQFVRETEAPRGAAEVYVVAKQWVWKFDYPGGQTSLHTLYVPAGRPVKLLITSRDVIHSFYVPAFRVKMDAVPGRYTTYWFQADEPGIHDIYCAEYCGASHSRMRGAVVVLRPEDYETWLRGQVPAGSPRETSLASLGRTVAATKGCLQCHSLDGSRSIGPTWLDLFGRRETLVDGRSVAVDGGYVTESMMEPNAKVVLGYAPVMPSYQGRIEPGETAAIVELMKTLSRYGGESPGAR